MCIIYSSHTYIYIHVYIYIWYWVSIATLPDGGYSLITSRNDPSAGEIFIYIYIYIFFLNQQLTICLYFDTPGQGS